MTIVYGAEYTEYSWLLISYSGIYLCLLLAFPLRICLRTLENTKHIFFAYITTGIFSLILSQFFVSQWALQGVISGMLIVNVIMLIMLMYFVKHSLSLHKKDPKIKEVI
jgi:O-antigen/teichoic acid export membrane protein